MISLPQFPAHPSCTLCPLHTGAKSVGVPTTFLEDSLLPPSPTGIVFLGMNPGFQEDQQNAPFVGKAGQRLREVYIDGLDLRKRSSIYLTNTVRCGPSPKFPKACAPSCFPYTVADISAIAPSHTRLAVVCLGAIATAQFFRWASGRGEGKTKAVSQQEGFTRSGEEIKAHLSQHEEGVDAGTLTWKDQPFTHFSVYHPSALDYNPRLATELPDQLEMLNKWLDGIVTAPPTPLIIPPISPEDYFK